MARCHGKHTGLILHRDQPLANGAEGCERHRLASARSKQRERISQSLQNWLCPLVTESTVESSDNPQDAECDNLLLAPAYGRSPDRFSLPQTAYTTVATSLGPISCLFWP